MTIITEEIMEETVDDAEKTVAETVKDVSGRTVASAVENSGEGAAAETVEESMGETVEETIEETVEETPGQVKGANASKPRRGLRFRLEMRNPGRKKISGMKVQGEQWKRVAGWLAPYVAALLLIMLTGGAILLATSVKTDYLSKQIQEQYGEYFTDGE